MLRSQVFNFLSIRLGLFSLFLLHMSEPHLYASHCACPGSACFAVTCSAYLAGIWSALCSSLARGYECGEESGPMHLSMWSSVCRYCYSLMFVIYDHHVARIIECWLVILTITRQRTCTGSVAGLACWLAVLVWHCQVQFDTSRLKRTRWYRMVESKCRSNKSNLSHVPYSGLDLRSRCWLRGYQFNFAI